MKRMCIICLLFAFFIKCFANDKITLYIPDYSLKMLPDSRACEIEIDELGRIICIKIDKDKTYTEITYGKSIVYKIKSSNKDEEVIELGVYKSNVENDSFEIRRTTKNSTNMYSYNNGLFITKDIQKNTHDGFYVCRKNNDCYELNYMFNNGSWKELGYNWDGDCFDEYGYVYKIPQSEIAKLRTKDKNINLSNAYVLLVNDTYLEGLVPFLFFDNPVTTAVAYKASSELKEKNTIYAANNLKSLDGLPWASANGYGINDKVYIKTPTLSSMKLCIYNGFQSDKRKDLYKANSRVKKIKIKSLESGQSIEKELKDNEEKQLLDLSSLRIDTNIYTNLEITILEVYPGEKYKDLCIQAIIPVY